MIDAEEKKYWKKNTISVQPHGSNQFHVYRIEIKQGPYSNSLVDVITNTFHNCQNFTIASMYQMIKLPQYAFNRAFALAITIANKHQVIVDIKSNKVEELKKKVELFQSASESDKHKFKVTEYISTNGSDMCLVYIRLNSAAINAMNKSLEMGGLLQFDDYMEPIRTQCKMLVPKKPTRAKNDKVVEEAVSESTTDRTLKSFLETYASISVPPHLYGIHGPRREANRRRLPLRRRFNPISNKITTRRLWQ
tara:strand:+ start:40514 stop:41263 length:750 start_codon:yes stop_codon:yes gene_type:complete